jgi:predicted phosphohydrolase
MPSGVDRILHDDLVGLSLRRDGADPLHAYRVLLLVRGTEDTDLDPIDEKNTAFKLISKNVSCLLSDSPTTVQLVAYSDLKKSLLFRLDREAALVLVSAVEHYMPVSDSSEPNEKPGLIATVEHMEKLSKDHVEILERTLTLEWKSVLTSENETEISSGPKRILASHHEYWAQETRKLRRLTSEPIWPPVSNS